MSDVHDGLRPYVHHGVELEVRNNHGVGDCPLCGADGKFSADCDSGLWRCFVCGGGTDSGGGNALTFLRLLHAAAVDSTGQEFLEEVATDRRLCDPDTVSAWGVCQSPIGGNWLVPGYGPDGDMDQLYRRSRVQDSDGEWYWALLPTPGVWPEGRSHALHMAVRDFDPDTRPSVAVCEGPWDAMALWEALTDELGDCNVVGVPGCNVWRDTWTAMCRMKLVTVLFDSDHPRQQGIRLFRPGYDGVMRVAKRLSGSAATVAFLRWGPDGYDPERPDGWDVRDELSGSPDDPLLVEQRREVLYELLKKVEHAPLEWFSSAAPYASNGSTHDNVETKSCSAWNDCEASWREAVYWRADMADTMKVVLAVCASTHQSGNQLFFDVVGSPGVAKTTILRGALTSRHCIHVENISKLISGYKKPDDGDKDCSFIARANNKTWITCEFDTILSSPEYSQLMGKMRRIFDGETSATYGNSDIDRKYSALRTPWIRAGTWRMMDTDQSQLGDRFLRIIINDPTEEEKYDILLNAMMAERSAMLEQTNCTSTSIVDEKTRKAYALTGGYIDWLRANVGDKLPIIESKVSREEMLIFARMADLSASLRARPNEDKRKKENTDSAEFPARLARQYTRLAHHLAVVLNMDSLDDEVLRIVRKVALNTACGHTLNIANWMCAPNARTDNTRTHQECGGISQPTLGAWCGIPNERMENYLMFLRKIGVLELRRPAQGGPTWLLSERIYDLYTKVMGTR